MKTNLTLGRAIALISQVENEKQLNGTAQEKEYLRHLTAIRNSFKDAPDRVENIFESISNGRCKVERSKLATEEFFTYYLLKYSPGNPGGNHCQRLTTHLNDCFPCFEEYSDVMRDFYNQNNNLL